METPSGAVQQIQDFIEKEKFLPEPLYPGLANPEMKPLFTKRINEIAIEFRKVATSENPTNWNYQEKINGGLDMFASDYLNLDTEDRERICSYIEELMDIVQLESSNGALNDFMYGFDPD